LPIANTAEQLTLQGSSRECAATARAIQLVRRPQSVIPEGLLGPAREEAR
jgi:hypothetical protein